ncbi:MAG: small basic protein [Candidatus Omnitrophica bacterium]|nr:small basic protein [Candidatus Omnitrophota bacterium]MDD5488814.1 small basic protein [Candidatus Omnitrophota bacterium]
MTQHSSLKGSSSVGAAFRSVLKRYERIKELTNKEKWSEEKDSVFHLPKLKRIKFKVKKTKGPAAEGAEGAAGAAGTAAAPGSAAAKPAEAKDAGKKDAGKKAGGKK